MSTATKPPLSPAIEYPDSDGNPMAENTLQFQWIVTIKEGVEAIHRDDPDVFVAGDLLWYPVEGVPTERMAPDTLIAFGRPKGHRGSYMQWREGGIAPQVVFEVLSPGNRAGELQRKFDFYERHGVEEYYIYDPDTGEVEGYLRRGGRLCKIAQMDGHISPRLRIEFRPGEGPDNLTIIGPDGERFKTFQELHKDYHEAVRQAEEAARQAEEATHQAEEANRQAKEATRQLDEQTRRTAAYAAKLRELGIEPD